MTKKRSSSFNGDPGTPRPVQDPGSSTSSFTKVKDPYAKKSSNSTDK